MSEPNDRPGHPLDTLVGAWLGVPDVAEILGTDVVHVRQLVKDGRLVAVRRDGVLSVPADFLADGEIVKGLPGTITVLRDGGYGDDELLRWLFTADDSLPGSPLQALRENRGTEVRRRAMALAL